MIGMTAEQTQAQADSGTPAWMIALRDAVLVALLTAVPAVLLSQPSNWADFVAFDHVGVPLLTGIEMFIVSLCYRYKVVVPQLPSKP